MYQLPNWSGACRNVFHEHLPIARGDTHQHAYPQYNYMPANGMQDNIRGDAAVRMFRSSTPPRLVDMICLAVAELGEICSMSVRNLHAELHTNLHVHHSNIYAPKDIQENISGDAAGRMFVG